MNISHKAVLVF